MVAFINTFWATVYYFLENFEIYFAWMKVLGAKIFYSKRVDKGTSAESVLDKTLSKQICKINVLGHGLVITPQIKQWFVITYSCHR